jgi:hypothetical protein
VKLKAEAFAGEAAASRAVARMAAMERKFTDSALLAFFGIASLPPKVEAQSEL